MSPGPTVDAASRFGTAAIQMVTETAKAVGDSGTNCRLRETQPPGYSQRVANQDILLWLLHLQCVVPASCRSCPHRLAA